MSTIRLAAAAAAASLCIVSSPCARGATVGPEHTVETIHDYSFPVETIRDS